MRATLLTSAAGLLLLSPVLAGDRPVFGILVQPLQLDNPRDQLLLKYGEMYLVASYVKAIEAAGARAAPVLYNSTKDDLRALFGRLSGLILPGGHVGHVHTDYADAVYTLLDLAAGEAGFPVHGTCLGSQMLAQWASGDLDNSVLSKTDAENLNLPLRPRPSWTSSWLLDGAPPAALASLEYSNSTVNLHGYGVLPSKFDSGGKLDTGVLNPLATSVGNDGVEFVALYEGVPPQYAAWSATQYHPEKNAFEWGGGYQKSSTAVHSDAGIEASTWLMRKLVNASRAVAHEWVEDDPTFPLMRQFAPVPGGGDSGFDWESCYFW